MTKTALALTAAACLAAGVAGTAHAAIVYQTDFDSVPAAYAAGELNGQNGWVNDSPGKKIDVVDLGGNQVADVIVGFTAVYTQSFAAVGGTVFMRVDMLNTHASDWSTLMVRSGSSDVLAFAVDDGNLSIQDRTNFENVLLGSYGGGFSTLVGAYDAATSTFFGWDNPDASDYYNTALDNSADASVVIDAAPVTLDSIRLRARSAQAQYDNIVIATSPTDVGLLVPEPSSLALLGLGGLLVVPRRRG